MMAGPIVLVGGDEFRPGCEEMDRAILDACRAASPRVVVLPTAAASENPAKAASNGVAYFSSLGADASALMVLGPADANDSEIVSAIDGAHLIYFTGGNPAHLLKTLQGSLLRERLTRAWTEGALLGGSSAGAMVMGQWMRFRGWTPALSILPGVVTLPHHEGSNPDTISADLSASAPAGVTVLGIDSMTGCLGGPTSWTVVGSGSVVVYQEGRWRRFKPGDELNL